MDISKIYRVKLVFSTSHDSLISYARNDVTQYDYFELPHNDQKPS